MTKLQLSLEKKEPTSNAIDDTFTDGTGMSHTATLYKLEDVDG